MTCLNNRLSKYFKYIVNITQIRVHIEFWYFSIFKNVLSIILHKYTNVLFLFHDFTFSFTSSLLYIYHYKKECIKIKDVRLAGLYFVILIICTLRTTEACPANQIRWACAFSKYAPDDIWKSMYLPPMKKLLGGIGGKRQNKYLFNCDDIYVRGQKFSDFGPYENISAPPS